MRPIHSFALVLFLAAPLSAPAFAAEPDAPQALITRAEAIRMAVQNRLSAKFSATSEHKKDETGALVEYYSTPDQKLLWVDGNGLTDRGKAAVTEISQADDYGLRAADYELPRMAGFDAGSTTATEELADAEIKISYAVLDYAYDARGGRITPSRISKNLDPTLALPDPLEVIEFDRVPLRSGFVSAELPARSASVRTAPQETHRASRWRSAGRCGNAHGQDPGRPAPQIRHGGPPGRAAPDPARRASRRESRAL